MKIDAYSHILPRRYFDEMVKHVTDPGALKRWLDLPALHDLDARLSMMEEFGDEYQQILTLSSPPIELLAGPDVAVKLARLANETMREVVDDHPDRFPAFVASLPMNAPDAAVEEARYAIDVLGARGAQVFTNVNGVPLDHPDFEPIFAEMAGRDLPVWMHPARGAKCADYPTEDTSKFEIWWAFGWPYETSAAMARMVFSGLFDRHPGLKVITHHMGAMIPAMEGRIRLGWADQFGSRTDDPSYERLVDGLKREPIEYFRNFYADTALSGSAIGTRCGLEFFGVGNVLFASDCPFDPEGGPLYVREMIRVIDELDVDDDERRRIYAGNVTALMGLARSH
ncbi:amidohydrolase family protein [Phytoactinopolyspora endophytica]|uniref:amidohydrolase family protein n=1 Tax=Phytoactinopolyspora endophytica TaxID=1642495 RepID=UPI00197B8DCA|nr:amidohydrolase family protein [Phytoactinopolyspora endophytica]